MQNNFKKCEKVIEGEGVKVKVISYFGKRKLPDKIYVYCSEKCSWYDYLGKE